MYEIADFLYKITMAQHLLLLARVCPDVSHKADYSPNNKRYIQVFHKRELKRNKCDRVTMPFLQLSYHNGESERGIVIL